MSQLKALLNSLSLRQKFTIAAAVLVVAGGIFWFSHWNRERDFKPLYIGLAAEDAGAVAARLKDSAIDFRVSEGGTAILVRSAQVAETRLQMAAAGLPKTGRIGYELFDQHNFGITEFTEQVNYHRALEGELERSVMAVREVERARVHVTLPKNSLFLEQRLPAKASVMVKIRAGAELDQTNVLAIAHLVASAVEGLTPEGVSVLDMSGRLLSKPRQSAGAGQIDISDASLDYKKKIERDLVAKIETTLDPLLGPGKFRAGASVECDFSSGEQSEETFDPTRSVMVTAQKTEDISGAVSSGGVPGTASNLPRPAVRPASTSGAVTRRTENVSYQSSRTVRRVSLPQGGVKRMSVSVLLDQQVRWEGSGASAKRIIEPPSPEKLKVIRELVAAAIGFQSERGDQLIVDSLPFENTLSSEPPPVPSKPGPPEPGLQNWLTRLLGQKQLPVLAGIGGGLLLFLGFLLLRKLGRRKSRVDFEAGAPVLASGAPAMTAGGVRNQFEDQLMEQAAQKEQQLLDSLAHLKLPQVKTQKSEVLTRHISEEAKKDPQVVANVLRTWMSDR